MKYVMLAIISLLTFTHSHAFADGDPSSLMVFEVGGQKYYIQDHTVLQTLMNDNTCIQHVANGEIDKIYDLLYKSCQELVIQMRHDADIITENLSKVSQRQIQKQYNKTGDAHQAYQDCLVDAESIQRVLKNPDVLGQRQYRKKTHTLTFMANINECIKNIQITPQANYATCSMSRTPSVPDQKYIENLMDLNSTYVNKKFSFDLYFTPNFTTNKVLVFNGNVLVACEDGNPKFMVKPAFSGRDECHDGQYQSFTGMGGTPNGIYIVDKNGIEAMSRNHELWGGYRIRLWPANETDTHGRTSMYIHGTSTEGKTESAGCISLGMSITDFINQNFITGTVPVVVNIGTVYENWLKQGTTLPTAGPGTSNWRETLLPMDPSMRPFGMDPLNP